MNWDAEIGSAPNKCKLWGWKVARDYINDKDEDCYRQGNTYRDYQGGKFSYRLKDDDGNTMYIIESDIDPNEGYEEEIFAPLDWAMNDVGATLIEYKDKETGKYIIL